MGGGGDMGVGVQGEASGEVAQHSGHGLYVHAILQCDGCKGVSEVVESDLRDAGPCQHSFEHIVDTVRRNGTPVRGGEDILVIGFCLLCFKNFYCLW